MAPGRKVDDRAHSYREERGAKQPLEQVLPGPARDTPLGAGERWKRGVGLVLVPAGNARVVTAHAVLQPMIQSDRE